MSTLSTTGQFVVTGLTSESASRTEENDVFQYPISIATTSVNYYQSVSKELDLEVLSNIGSDIASINSKKQEAIDLGLAALGPFVPGVFPPLCGFYSDVEDLDNNISSGNEVIPAVEGGVGGIATTPAVAYSIVRSDAVRIRKYPYLEARTAPNDNALAGLVFPILNSGNAGQGQEDIWFANSQYVEPETGLTYSVSTDDGEWSVTGFDGESGDTLGRFYQVDPTGVGNSTFILIGELSEGLVFVPDSEYSGITSYFVGVQSAQWDPYQVGILTTPCDWNPLTGQLVQTGAGAIELAPGEGRLLVSSTGACVGIASAQQALLDDIDTLRVGISTWFVSTNTTKARKHGAQLELWAIERIKIRNQQETSGINDNPRDISQAIPATEAADPNLPTNSNTADADRGDLKADNDNLTSDSK